MKITVGRAASIVLLASMAICSNAQAALVEWTFFAAVRDIDGNAAGMANFGVTTETTLSVTFLLDNSVSGNNSNDDVWYDGAVVGVDVNAGAFQASLDPIAGFNTLLVRDQEFDAVGVSASLVIENGTDSTIGFVATQFISSDGSLVNNTLFPSIPDFSNVDSYYGDIAGGTFFVFQASIDGVFTTVQAEIFSPEARLLPVPLPGALFLMGGGLLATFRIGRRR